MSLSGKTCCWVSAESDPGHSGCHSKVPLTGEQPQTFIVSQCWRLEVSGQV